MIRPNHPTWSEQGQGLAARQGLQQVQRHTPVAPRASGVGGPVSVATLHRRSGGAALHHSNMAAEFSGESTPEAGNACHGAGLKRQAAYIISSAEAASAGLWPSDEWRAAQHSSQHLPHRSSYSGSGPGPAGVDAQSMRLPCLGRTGAVLEAAGAVAAAAAAGRQQQQGEVKKPSNHSMPLQAHPKHDSAQSLSEAEAEAVSAQPAGVEGEGEGEEPPCCRICYSAETKVSPLVSPCACRQVVTARCPMSATPSHAAPAV